jgi:Ca2+-binding EF-hand superfamily protein
MPQGPPMKVDMSELVLGEFRKLILKRGGAHGIQTLGRTFRIMDSNKNQLISSEELEIGLGRFGLHMPPKDLDLLMSTIDKNGTRTISYDEFMVAIRGQINKRREKLIMMAFDTLDRTRDGRITADDAANAFDANHHPEVLAGKMNPKHALGDFLSQFDCLDHDGCITKKEFLEYYKNVSSSIDDDDYFELMIRNAWHIAGGSGWCANTTNKRILVTFNDGTQKVVGLEHDMGQDLRNHAVVQRLLDQQGVRNVKSWKLSG